MVLKRRLKFSLLGGLAVLLMGCSFEAPAPNRTPAPSAPVTPVSTIAATVMVSAGQLDRLFTNMTQYRIADLKNQTIKCGPLKCRLDLNAERTGPLSVTVADDALGIRMPFAARAQLSTAGLLSFLHGQAEGDGVAAAHTGVTVSPNLQLHSSTTGTVTLSNGHLRIGPVVTNIARIWNDNEETLSRPLWRSFDQQIAQLPLKPRIARLWKDAFRPVKIGKSPVSWLVLRPQSLAIAQPRLRDGNITLSIALSAQARVLVEDSEPVNVPSPLPTVRILHTPSRDFSFNVPLLLPYGEASHLALVSLTNRPPRVGGAIIKFAKLDILPSGSDVVVSTNFCADPQWDLFGWFASCGTVYLRGVPVFDPVTRTIRVEGLHYDVGSANIMFSAVRALAGDVLTRLLQERLVFHEANQIDRLERHITQILARPQGQELSVSARNVSFGMPAFCWTADGFLAVFSAKGQVNASLNL